MLGGELVGLLVSIALVVLTAESAPSDASIFWSVTAGTIGVVGLGAFYFALSRGTMGVVAPLSAVIGAGLPVAVAIIGGESLGLGRAAGIVLALVAVVLISLPGQARTTDERRLLRIDLGELPLVLVAGGCFGLFFLLIDRATANGETWWPLILVRAAGLVVVMLAMIPATARVHGRPSWRARGAVVLGVPKLRARAVTPVRLSGLFLVTGLGDLGGNAFFVLAVRADALAVAVVLSALYPVVTTLLAAAFLHERLRAIQIGGVVLATLSVALLH